MVEVRDEVLDWDGDEWEPEFGRHWGRLAALTLDEWDCECHIYLCVLGR